jgi:ABC-type lipoprotein export system ATPase subunit
MIAPLETRSLGCQRQTQEGFHSVSIRFAPGSFSVLTGNAHASRLLWRVLGLLESHDEGELFLHGSPTGRIGPEALEQLRNRHCGYLFSTPFLLPSLSVLENVAMPLFKLAHIDPSIAEERMHELLGFVDLHQLAHECVSSLSPAQQLHVALARSICHHPAVLMVEQLDLQLPQPGMMKFTELLQSAARQWNIAVIASATTWNGPGRILTLNEGRCLTEESGKSTPSDPIP